MTIPRELILAEINKGIAAARAAYPDLIPHDAESMAAATLQITPTTTTTKEETDMAVHHDVRPDMHPIPKQGPAVDDATLAAMAKAARKTVDQMRNAGPLSQWLALGFIVSLSPAGLRKHGITVPQSARDYWANLATTTEETDMEKLEANIGLMPVDTAFVTVKDAEMILANARKQEAINDYRDEINRVGLSSIIAKADAAMDDGHPAVYVPSTAAKVIFEMAEAYRMSEQQADTLEPRLAAIEAATGITQGVQNVMVSRSDDTTESEDDDEVDAVLAEDAARMLRKHRQDMMRDIIGNKSYESLDSQVKHLRNITEIIDQLGRIY